MRSVLEVKDHVPTLEQFQGALLGCAVGDATGALVETRSPADCKVFVDKVLRPRDFERLTKTTYGTRSPGQYTDDTQLSCLLMSALSQHLEHFPEQDFDPEAFSVEFAEKVVGKEIVGTGKTTRQAAIRLLEGDPWQDSGAPDPMASNGSAMRVFPVGLAYYNQWERLQRAAEDQSRPSHAGTFCIAGSQLVAMAVAMAATASKRTTHPEEMGWWNWLHLHTAKLEGEGAQVFAEALRKLIDQKLVSKSSDEDIENWIVQTLDNGGWVNGGVSPYVVPCVISALYSFMRSPSDYWETICKAISLGGDTDTIAAIAGALSGAYNGLEAIPLSLREWVNDQGERGSEHLLGLSRDFYQKVMA